MQKILRDLRWYVVSAGLLVVFALFIWGGVHAQAATTSDPNGNGKTFMVYYRAWRDKTMQGVNTDIADANPQSMLDIPRGIDIVNVFSYVPAGQEAQAKPFFDTLKSTYAPALHKRGVKLVRALDYNSMVDGLIKEHGEDATDQEVDAYAKNLIDDLSGQWGLDGVDIDMESYPASDRVAISNKIVRAMSKYIGPKANNGTVFVYDTNGTYLPPFEDVQDCFSVLGYQQYGSGPSRTERMKQTYTKAGYSANQLLAGLTFPEEGDPVNRWYDTDPNSFLTCNMHTVAQYIKDNIGGMFVYAVDRDGRTYEQPDFSHIFKTTYRWTKTAILETKGYDLNVIKAAAYRHLGNLKLRADQPSQTELKEQIGKATNAYEVNSVFMSDDFDNSVDPLFDAVKEIQQPSVDKAKLQAGIAAAQKTHDGLSVKAAKRELKKVITEAQSVLADAAAAQPDVDQITATLAEAVTKAQLTEDRAIKASYNRGYRVGKADGRTGLASAYADTRNAVTDAYRDGYLAGYKVGHAEWVKANQTESTATNPATPVKPDAKPTQKPTTHRPAKKPVAGATTVTQTLPQNGEAHHPAVFALGAALLGLCGFGFWRQRSKAR